MPLGTFTTAQQEAWDFIRTAVDEEMTATASLQAYRAEGFSIRTQDWYRAFSAYKEAGDTWEQVSRFRDNETIPESMWLEAPRNFANRYVAEVHFQTRNLTTGELNSVFRYVESDYRMSLSEIKRGVQDATEEMQYSGSLAVEGDEVAIEFIYGYKFYQKGSIE